MSKEDARIVVIIVFTYEGEDVDDYNDAMSEAYGLVDSIGGDLQAAYPSVTGWQTEATG